MGMICKSNWFSAAKKFHWPLFPIQMLGFSQVLAAAATSQQLAMAAPPQLEIDFDHEDASFKVSVAGSLWLDSGRLRAFSAGNWRNLTKTNSAKGEGEDVLGHFSLFNVSWHDQSVDLVLHTSLKMYSGNVAVFEQHLPLGARRTNASNPVLPQGLLLDPGNYPPSVAFPSFAGDRLHTLGYVLWQSRMCNVEFGTNLTRGPGGRIEPLANGTGLQGLSTNGPVVLFDDQFNSLVVAPFDNFKSAVHTWSGEAWEAGVSSELTELPEGFRHRTMLVAGSGITATMDTWGKAVRKAYGTKRITDQDPNINYLSYWTDNGAYYSGGAWGESTTGGGTAVNEAAFKAVAAGLRQHDLLKAVRIWQLDDWWYPGHASIYVNCVRNWTFTTPAYFPSGLKNLSRALETPWLLYVPFFCPENVYTDQFRFVQSYNPNNTHMIISEPHPDDSAAFYRMLFDYGMSQGMAGFENDFLDVNFLGIPHFRKNYNAANKWLAGMDAAAVERGLPVQLCMAMPGDLMASLAFNSVTNYRASTDYGIADSSTPLQPRDGNYNIGGASLLGFALGLRPSKDILWTHRPSNCRGEDPVADPSACGRWGAHTNPGANCELNSLVATLSTGPVSLADKAGDTNATLVNRCIRGDGYILQPDKPATFVDSMFAPRKAPPSSGLVTATSATVGAKHVFHYILSIDVSAPWRLQAPDLYPRATTSPGAIGAAWVAHSWFTGHAETRCLHGELALASRCLLAAVEAGSAFPPIHNVRPIMVQNDSRAFDLLQLSPVVNGWALLGEVGKYVRVSNGRFTDVQFPQGGGICVALSGSAGETVSVVALQLTQGQDWTILVNNVTFDSSEKANMVFNTSLASPRN